MPLDQSCWRQLIEVLGSVLREVTGIPDIQGAAHVRVR